jgi:hypothetical protein
MESFKQIDFDAVALSKISDENPLFFLMSYLYDSYDFSASSLMLSTYNNFVYAIQELYHKENPYHNHIHSADVTQSILFYLETCEVKDILQLTETEVMTAYLSAAIHDVHHPGHKNDFEAKTGMTRAILYNDQSVLENYHVAIAFSLMKNGEYDIFKDIGSEELTKIRGNMIEWVLGTDNANHKPHEDEYIFTIESDGFDPSYHKKMIMR